MPYVQVGSGKVNGGVLLSCKPQEAIAQIFVGFEHAGKLCGHRGNVLVMNAARRHALVFCINQNGNAGWLKRFGDAIGNLCCHGFLGLQALAKDFDNAGNFRNTTT